MTQVKAAYICAHEQCMNESVSSRFSVDDGKN